MPRLIDRGGRKTGRSPRVRGFTLLELLVVVGLIAALSTILIKSIGNGGKSFSLKSAQSIMTGLVGVARSNAMASGRASRILTHVDPANFGEPSRYLRYLVVQLQGVDGNWATLAQVYLPDGVYVVPGSSTTLPAGLFSTASGVPWTRADDTPLRSTALRAAQIRPEIIGGNPSELWCGIVFSSTATTFESGDIVFARGHPRQPGSYAEGESPVELENPADVRGVTLSNYGVPALIDTRLGF